MVSDSETIFDIENLEIVINFRFTWHYKNSTWILQIVQTVTFWIPMHKMRVLLYIFVNVCVDRGAAWLIDGIFSNNLTPWVTLNLEVSDKKKNSWATFQNRRGSRDNSIWHIASGQGQEKIDFVKFQKCLYRKIELEKLCKIDIKAKHWQCIIIEM